MKRIYGTIFLDGEFKKATIGFSETIEEIWVGEKKKDAEVIPDDYYILPGFIDEHIHGGFKKDFMDADESAILEIAKGLAKEGVTGYLATTMSMPKKAIEEALKACAKYKMEESKEGAEMLGIHLEGPFLNSKYAGAQKKEDIISYQDGIMKSFMDLSHGLVKMMTVAPEMASDSLAIEAKQEGVALSIGHSNATYEEVEKAIEQGYTSITHTYNAQSPLHHRNIGVVGAALLQDRLYTEVIADGIHVSIPALKLLFKNKPNEKIILVTDAMRAKGCENGTYTLGGNDVFVKDGEARLEDGTLAGSVLKMNFAIQNMVEKVGVPLEKAILMATKNPAEHIGVYERVGSIDLGKLANLTMMSPNFEIQGTYIKGNLIFRK